MKLGHIRRYSINNIGLRFDASYHLSEGIAVKRTIMNSPYKLVSISDISSRCFIGNRAKRVYVNNSEKGIPFLSSSDILKAELENVKYASKKYTPQIKELTLEKGWTLISRSGTVGNCAFSTANHANKLASEHVMRLVPNGKIKEGMLFAYLASKIGYSLLTQGTFGAVIQHIEPDYVLSLPIPLFSDDFQKKVDDLIQQSALLREHAAHMLHLAVKYFDEKFPIEQNYTKFFTKNIKTLGLGFNAFNNNIEVSKFENQYRYKSFLLEEKTELIFAPPLFKHIYLTKDNGYPFMTGSELTKFNMRFYRWLSPKGVKEIKDYVVKKGTLLLYKSGTTDGGILGNVFIVDNKINNCCLSDHVIRIVFKDEDYAYWTFAFLKSKGGNKLLQSLATGTMIPFITPERVSNIRIPEPDGNFEKIVHLIDEYIKLSSLSKEKETEAISIVENEIESWNKN